MNNIFKTNKSCLEDNINSNFLENHKNEISVLELILILWKHKLCIVFCIIISTSIGVFIALTSKELFTAEALFITKTNSNSNNNINQLASLAGISFPINSNNSDPSSYLDIIINNQEFLSELFQKKWNFKGGKFFLDEILDIRPDKTMKNWEYYFYINKIEMVRKNKLISISKESKNGILNLKTVMPDPQLSFDIIKYTLDYISNYMRSSLQTQAKEKRRFIEERMKETQLELSNYENLLVKFKEQNTMSHSPKVMLEEARLTRNVTINQEMYLQFIKQYELARIEELDNQTLIQIVKSPEVPIKRIKPKRTQLTMVSFLLGGFFGILISFITEAMPKLRKMYNYKLKK